MALDGGDWCSSLPRERRQIHIEQGSGWAPQPVGTFLLSARMSYIQKQAVNGKSAEKWLPLSVTEKRYYIMERMPCCETTLH